jgi:S-ribosylhomocysteine lyase LuxS involved in autoinducer biosynthesis
MYVLFSGEPTGTEVIDILQKLYQWITELPDDFSIP